MPQVLISGVYYKHLPAECGEVLRAAVMSAELDDAPPPKAGERQSFRTDPPTSLKIVVSKWKELIFTEDGEVPTKSATAPLLRLMNDYRDLAAGEDLPSYAEKTIKSAPHFKDVKIHSMEQVNVNGLHGYELQARVALKKSGHSIDVYQLILENGDDLIMAFGEVGSDQADSYLPEFKAIARSIKLKED